jgi:hypothetical protein
MTLLFNIYKDKLPRDCLVNSYAPNVASGIESHRRHVSFCTAIICLLGNSEGDIILTLDNGQHKTVSLSTDDVLVFARMNIW